MTAPRASRPKVRPEVRARGADPRTLAELRARHKTEEHALVRKALEAGAWTLFRTAQILDVRVSTLQRLLGRHRDLERERVRRAAGRTPGPVTPERNTVT